MKRKIISLITIELDLHLTINLINHYRYIENQKKGIIHSLTTKTT